MEVHSGGSRVGDCVENQVQTLLGICVLKEVCENLYIWVLSDR